MAIGRRDYTYGYIPELQTGGRTVINKFENVYTHIDQDAWIDVIDYTVPNDKLLYLSMINIGSYTFNRYEWELYKGNTRILWNEGSDTFILPADPYMRLVWMSGERLYLRAFRLLGDEDWLHGSWLGLLDNVV